MRLWHQALIPHLPRQQLLGQHRECCALRGAGWGRKHSTVDYVFTHQPNSLVAYHCLIINEMKRRGYSPNEIWNNPNWRGSTLGEQEGWTNSYAVANIHAMGERGVIIYPEHDDKYLQECLDNLKSKGIIIDF